MSTHAMCYKALEFILSGDQKLIKEGELIIREIENKDSSLALVCFLIAVDPNQDLSKRQLAAVLGKQQIVSHWSQNSLKFSAPEIPKTVKENIKILLLTNIGVNLTKIRSQITSSINVICETDFPDHWPNLLDQLMSNLKGNQLELTLGTLKCLSDISGEIPVTSLPKVMDLLYPYLLDLFSNNKNPESIRLAALEVYNSFNKSLSSRRDEIKEKRTFNIFSSSLAKWFTSFNTFFSESQTETPIYSEIIQVLNVLLKYFSKESHIYFHSLLPFIWKLIVNSNKKFVQLRITEEIEDEDDFDFEKYTCNLLELLGSIALNKKLRIMVKQGLKDLLYMLVKFAQITEGDRIAWEADPNKFVADEEDTPMGLSVRVESETTLLNLIEIFEIEICQIFPHIVQMVFSESRDLKKSQNESWWKLEEAVLFLFGRISQEFVACVEERKLDFNFETFFIEAVNPIISLFNYPFLCGRGIWIASRFSSVIPKKSSVEYLKAAINIINGSSHTSSKISAIRSLHNFCSQLDHKLLNPFLIDIIQITCNSIPVTQGDLLSLLMETLLVAIKVDPKASSSKSEEIAKSLISVWFKFPEDHLLTSTLSEIIEEIAKSKTMDLEKNLLPVIVPVLQNPGEQTEGIVATGIDILNTLLKHGRQSLPYYIDPIFKYLINLLLSTEDTVLLQNGCECLITYLKKMPRELSAFPVNEQTNGLVVIARFMAKLLDPQESDSSSLFVGDLASQFVFEMGENLGSDFIPLLRAIVLKLASSESIVVIQPLVIIFARLILNQCENVMNFLGTEQLGNRSYLQVLMDIWCDKYSYFNGKKNIKTSNLALAKMFVSGHPAMQNVCIVERTGVISIYVKIVRILVSELDSLVSNEANEEEAEGHDEGEDSETWEDLEEDGDNSNKYQDLSEMVDEQDSEDEKESEEENRDPISQVDLKKELVAYFQQNGRQILSQPMFLSSLSNEEKEKIQVYATTSLNN